MIKSVAQQVDWIHEIDYSPGTDVINSITADSSGNSYVCGAFSGGPYGIFVHKYDPAGNLVWFDTVWAGYTNALSVQVYGNSLILTGRCKRNTLLKFGTFDLVSGTTGNYTFFVRYSLDGIVQLARLHSKIVPVQAKLYDSILYLAGGYDASYQALFRFDMNFDLLSIKNLYITGAPVNDLEVVDENNIYIILVGTGSSGANLVRKYDSTGTLHWASSFGMVNRDLFSDSDGNIYLAGDSGPAQVVKFDASGDVLSDHFPPLQSGAHQVYASGEELYSTGTTITSPPQKYITKYNRDSLVYNFLLGRYSNEVLYGAGDAAYVGVGTISSISKAYYMKITEKELDPSATLMTEDLMTSVSELKEEAAFSVYPNPARRVFTITYESDQRADLFIRVVAANGEVVFSEITRNFMGSYKQVLDLGAKAKGLYTVEVSQEQRKLSRKVMMH